MAGASRGLTGFTDPGRDVDHLAQAGPPFVPDLPRVPAVAAGLVMALAAGGPAQRRVPRLSRG